MTGLGIPSAYAEDITNRVMAKTNNDFFIFSSPFNI